MKVVSVGAQRAGLRVEDIVLCQPDSGEMALEVVDQLVRSNAIDLIAVDSVGRAGAARRDRGRNRRRAGCGCLLLLLACVLVHSVQHIAAKEAGITNALGSRYNVLSLVSASVHACLSYRAWGDLSILLVPCRHSVLATF